MSEDAIITSDRRSGRVATSRKSGFYYNWGPQAWIDMWMSNSMLVKKAMPIISQPTATMVITIVQNIVVYSSDPGTG